MNEWHEYRVVLTGATGFLGRNTARHLLEAGAHVFAVVRPSSTHLDALPAGEITVIRRELSDTAGIAADIGHADAFLHFAWGGVNRAEIDSPEVQKENIAHSMACLHTAKMLQCQLFMDAGSRVEYGVTADGVMREDMPCCPVNAYGKAKLRFYTLAREQCMAWGLTYVHLRFFSVYGLGDHPWSIISTLTRDLPKGENIALSACRHRWNFMHIDDAARAVLALMQNADSFQGQTHIVNIASADTRTLKDFVECIHDLCGGRGSLTYGTYELAKEGALSICPDITVLQRLTNGGWQEEITFTRGIQGMLDIHP